MSNKFFKIQNVCGSFQLPNNDKPNQNKELIL